jgi:O-antigen/teichoic acid export membrane protein
MQKKFLSNLVWMVFFNLLIKPYAIFGIDAEVQNRVGTEEYGLYFTLLNFSYLFNIFLDLGITNYNTRYVAQHPNLVKRYIGNILSLRLVLFVVYVVLSIGLAFVLGYNAKQFWFVYVLIFNQFLVSILLYFRSCFAGLLLFKWDIFLSILDRILLIGIISVLLYHPFFQGDFDIKWFALAQTASFLISVLVAVLLVFKRIGLPRLHWGKAFNVVILKKSFPYALLILLMMLYTRVDAMMIERLHVHGNKQVGIYAQAFRMLEASLMFIMLFTGLLFPLFSRILKDKTSIIPLLDTSSKLVVAFTTLMSFTSCLFAYFILDSIYLHDILYVVPTFQLLMLSLIPTAFIFVYGTLMTANGDLKRLNILSLIGLVLNVLLNFILIPKHGAFGAAFATFLTQLLIAIFYFSSVWKQFKLHFQGGELLRYSVYVLWCLIAAWVSKQVNVEIYQFGAFIGLLISGMFLMGLIPIKKMLSSFKKEIQ